MSASGNAPAGCRYRSEVTNHPTPPRRPRHSGTSDRPFAGNAGTGRYCGPVCDDRPRTDAGARFFASATAAEHAGLHPCPRCRPDLVPDRKAASDAARRLASPESIVESCGYRNCSVRDVAARLGMTPEAVEAAVGARHGLTFAAYVETRRRMLARHLIERTGLSFAAIAAAAGFTGTVAMRTAFGPGGLPSTARDGSRAGSVSLWIGYHPPLAWPHLLAFLEGRAIQGVEQVSDDAYWRTACLHADGRDHRGWLRVRPARAHDCLEVTVSKSLVPVLPAVLRRVQSLFDVAADPLEIEARLGELAKQVPGLRVPGAFEPFEMAVRAILGQQITVKAARTLAGRFAAAFGTPVETPLSGLSTCFPAPDTIVAQPVDAIASLGIVGARTRAILALADALAQAHVALEPHADIERELARLRALPGVGEWTAQYIAMRALGWPDAFPHTDYGVRKALGTTSDREVLARAEAWRPWRAYAVLHLWHGLASKPA